MSEAKLLYKLLFKFCLISVYHQFIKILTLTTNRYQCHMILQNNFSILI